MEYYRSPEGKIKKKYLNARRNGKSSPDANPVNDCQVALDQVMIGHMQVTTGLIEGRTVSLGEIIRMIAGIMRQLRIDKGKKMSYLSASAHDSPP